MPSFTSIESGTDTTQGTSVSTGSFTPSADAVLLVEVHIENVGSATAPARPALSGLGLTWDFVDESRPGGIIDFGAVASFLFRAETGASPSTGSITIDTSSGTGANTNEAWIWRVFETTDAALGNNGADAIVQSANNSSESTSASVTLASFADATNNSALFFVGFGNAGTNSGTVNLTNTYAELDQDEINHLAGDEVGENTSPDATLDSSALWAAVAAEVAAAATAVSNARLADMAFCRGTVPFGVGRLPIPDGTID